MTAQHRPDLLRVLGLSFGIAVVIGNVIGSGILRSPGIVAGALPGYWLILGAWAIGAAITLIDSFATVEVATSVPSAGGPYAFAQRAFGPFLGFLTGWSDWLQGTLSSAFIAVVFGEYIIRLGWGGPFSEGPLAVLLLAATAAIALGHTRHAGLSQNIGAAVKGFALVAVIAAVLLLAPPAAAAPGPAPSTLVTIAGVSLAAQAIYNTYGGWQATGYFNEEIRDPGRNIPRAIFGGIALVTAIYLLANIAMLHALTIPQIAASKLPMGDAVATVFGPRGDFLLTLLAIITVATTVNLKTMRQARTAFAMARDGTLPGAVARLKPNGSPAGGVWMGLLVASALALAGGFEDLLQIYAPIITLASATVGIAAIVLRRREPDLPRPFRMPWYPWPAILGAGLNLALTALFFIEDWEHARWSALLLLAALPWWLLRHRLGPLAGARA